MSREAATSGAPHVARYAGSCGLLIEQREILCGLAAGQRAQEGPDIGRVLVGQHGGRERRHVVGRFAQERLERLDRQFERGEGRGRIIEGAALAGAAVTGEAAQLGVHQFPVGGVAGGVLREGGGAQGESEQTSGERAYEQTSHRVLRTCSPDGAARSAAQSGVPHSAALHAGYDHLGSVTTSTNAGWPLLTVATARLSAGARSLGSVIGPSPCT